MKQIYVIAFLLFSVCSFSQLYITPNHTIDSYLYIEGQFLFVEGLIDLQLNPSEKTKASIYLRNEAQLLQGIKGAKNGGNGLLSVFQEGKASAYTYNYWGAPVLVPSANKAFGTIFFEPLDKTHSRKAEITSQLNGKAQPLSISNKWIYKFSGLGYASWHYIGNSFDLAPGEGFTMKGGEGVNNTVIIHGVPNNPGNEQRYDFRGLPNNGIIELPVNSGEIKLIGNPYPSALDLNAFLQENLNLTGIAYFWDSAMFASHELKEYEGGYAAFAPMGENHKGNYVPAVYSKYDNQGIPVAQTGEVGNFYTRDFSSIAQGFMVEGKETGTIRFKNEYRSFQKEDHLSSQFKQQLVSSRQIPKEVSPFLRLNVGFKNYIRQLLLVSHPKSTAGVDRAMDARNIAVLANDIGWYLGEQHYLINVMPLNSLMEIPLILKLTEDTDVNFGIGAQNIPGDIFLLDKQTGTYHNLKSEDLLIKISKQEELKRFLLVLDSREPETPLFEPGRSDGPVYFIAQNNNEQLLQIEVPTENPFLFITLFDNSGRRIFRHKLKDNQTNYSFSTNNLSNGVYIVKITDETERKITKKIIISN